MRTIYTSRHLKSFPFTLVVFSAILFVGCSGYQSVSYHQDGIYDGTVEPQATYQQAQAPTNPSGTYYKNYFSEKAAQGVQDDYIFTDAEQYQDATPDQASDGNYQSHGSWEDQADRINVNIIYNRPSAWGLGWYNAPFSYGRSSFWGYNYHPWYFNNYHNPYYNPYYYNPHRFGWGYNNWFNRPYYRERYYGPSYYRNPVRYSRLRGPRAVNQNRISSSRDLRGSDTSRTLNRRSTTTRRSQTTTQPNARTQQNVNTQARTTTKQTSTAAPSRTTARKQQEDTTTRTPRTYSNESSSNNNTSYRRPSSSSSNSSYRRSSSSSRSSGSSSSRRSSSSSSSRRR